ncbi:MAG: hypothetical protein EPN85_09695 [Bacteroidetes bacterium]|nr:MAG: hypothetical protein EPN85_09695 [Bacteroidota bacterium]
MAPKTSIIIHGMELGKPNALPYMGRNSAKRNNGVEGRGYDKKQMATGNKLHRGLKCAST